jgi:hypothetical protein
VSEREGRRWRYLARKRGRGKSGEHKIKESERERERDRESEREDLRRFGERSERESNTEKAIVQWQGQSKVVS